MTVKKLIEILAKAPSNAVVKVWCDDTNEFEEVDGIEWVDGDYSEVLIQTKIPSAHAAK